MKEALREKAWSIPTFIAGQLEDPPLEPQPMLKMLLAKLTNETRVEDDTFQQLKKAAEDGSRRLAFKLAYEYTTLTCSSLFARVKRYQKELKEKDAEIAKLRAMNDANKTPAATKKEMERLHAELASWKDKYKDAMKSDKVAQAEVVKLKYQNAQLEKLLKSLKADPDKIAAAAQNVPRGWQSPEPTKEDEIDGLDLFEYPSAPVRESNLHVLQGCCLIKESHPGDALAVLISEDRFKKHMGDNYLDAALKSAIEDAKGSVSSDHYTDKYNGDKLEWKPPNPKEEIARVLNLYLFANPTQELTNRIEECCEGLGDKVSIKAGPPKEPERVKAKSREYVEQIEAGKASKRIKAYLENCHKLRWGEQEDEKAPEKAKKPKDKGDRKEEEDIDSKEMDPVGGAEQEEEGKKVTAEDLELAVNDLLRVSITCDEPATVLRTVKCVMKLPGSRLIGVKNTFDWNEDVSPAQYRDVKVMLAVDYRNWDNCFWFTKEGPVQLAPTGKFTLVTEVQVTLETWTKVKKQNGIQYKVRRARSVEDLKQDTKKYLDRNITAEAAVAGGVPALEAGADDQKEDPNTAENQADKKTEETTAEASKKEDAAKEAPKEAGKEAPKEAAKEAAASKTEDAAKEDDSKENETTDIPVKEAVV